MDQRSLKTWTKFVSEPITDDHNISFLLVNYISWYKQKSSLEVAIPIQVSVKAIRGGWAFVLKQCDTGVVKSLKHAH